MGVTPDGRRSRSAAPLREGRARRPGRQRHPHRGGRRLPAGAGPGALQRHDRRRHQRREDDSAAGHGGRDRSRGADHHRRAGARAGAAQGRRPAPQLCGDGGAGRQLRGPGRGLDGSAWCAAPCGRTPTGSSSARSSAPRSSTCSTRWARATTGRCRPSTPGPPATCSTASPPTPSSASEQLPHEASFQLIAGGLDYVVFISRHPKTGKRRLDSVLEVNGFDDTVQASEIFAAGPGRVGDLDRHHALAHRPAGSGRLAPPGPGRVVSEHVPDCDDRTPPGSRPGRQPAAAGGGPRRVGSPSRKHQRGHAAPGDVLWGSQARRRALRRGCGRAGGRGAHQLAGCRRRSRGGDLPVAHDVRRRRAAARTGRAGRGPGHLDRVAARLHRRVDRPGGGDPALAVRGAPGPQAGAAAAGGPAAGADPAAAGAGRLRRGVRGLLGRPGGRGPDPQLQAPRPGSGGHPDAPWPPRRARRSTCGGGSRKAASPCAAPR